MIIGTPFYAQSRYKNLRIQLSLGHDGMGYLIINNLSKVALEILLKIITIF
jgi:hypothetical protein